jgi:feruloyl esterase
MVRHSLLCLFAAAVPAWAASCESLKSLALPDTTITRAEAVAAGQFTMPQGGVRPGQSAPDLSRLPAFCRVGATMRPSKDSEIKMEVWLPASGWNGKFQAVGNGGWNGNIVYPSLVRAVERGYASASTNTGHDGATGEFALGHPEKVIDFGYRAVHEMTVKAKAIIAAYYGDGPKLSYWNGCSSGGKQGLKEAQRFPADYDGIIAGAPANNWTNQMSQGIWIAQFTHKDGALIPPSKYELIHKAVLAACDALDGVKDGVIEDPRRCHFDPKVLLCKGPDSAACLTAAQVETARKMYEPAKVPRTGQVFYPLLEPGSELGWGGLAGERPFQIPVDHFRYIVFRNPDWDWHKMNFDTDVALAEKLDHDTINATDPNLKAFFGHGGKLLLYHGWNDQLIAPRNAINYYKSVVDTVGGEAKAADSMRLFMVPGMGHCQGGEGAGSFDPMNVIETWVEKGKAPERIDGAHISNGKVERTHPMCPYPQTAQYKGSGSSDDAANFVCK